MILGISPRKIYTTIAQLSINNQNHSHGTFSSTWGCHEVFLSRSSLSTHEAGQDGSICSDHSKQKKMDTWDEVVKRLLILGSAGFSLPTGIAEGAEPRRRVVVFLEKKIGEWDPSF